MDLMTKNRKKFTAEKCEIFLSKITIYLSLALHKWSQATVQEKPSALKREHTTLQNMKYWNFLHFFYFCGKFCLPGSGSGFRIRIHWSDWIRIQSGSWPEKLISDPQHKIWPRSKVSVDSKTAQELHKRMFIFRPLHEQKWDNPEAEIDD